MKFYQYARFVWLLCLWVTFHPAPSFSQAVTFDRVYTKVESSTGEHCSGWTIELWKTGISFVGILDHHRGLCGDPPTGILEDVSYDPKSGSISFTSKISDAWDADGKPTCDLLSFEGHLSDVKLVGLMKWRSAGISQPPESLELPRAKADPFGNREYDSIASWRKSRADALKFRGPRC